MDFLIDPRSEPFLGDHLVGGAALLPTVLGLDLLVRSQVAAGMDVTHVSDVVVAEPVRFVDGAARRLVTESCADPTGGTRWQVIGAAGMAHWSALRPASPTMIDRPRSHSVPEPTPSTGGVRAADLYPPHFHGPTFQVVGLVQPAEDGVVSTYASDLPGLARSFGPLSYPARLLELVLQTCGVWHLADTGRLMVPAGIGDITWSHGDDLLGRRITAHIVAGEPGRTGERLLLGTVAVNDEVLLSVDGYATVDLGLPADAALADRFRRLLADPTALEGVPA